MAQVTSATQTERAEALEKQHKSITSHAEAVFTPLIQFTEDQVQQQLNETNDRTGLLQELEELAQNVRLQDGDINWEGNEDMKKLVDLARKLGTILPPGYAWPEAKAKAIIEGIKGTVDKLNSMNHRDEYRLKKLVDHIANLYTLLKSIASKENEATQFIIQKG
jgi:hypothetical protein